MGVSPVFSAVVLIILGTIALAGYLFAGGPVSRARVETFARRQRLTVTVANGNQVIRYLATTRRWRVTGFVGGLVLSQLDAPPQVTPYFSFSVIFLGWFFGALVAEGAVAVLEYGSPRTASLQPRRPDRYVRRFAWALVPATAALSVLATAGTAAAESLDRAHPDWGRAGGLTVGTLMLAVGIRVIQHRVLRRPQPHAAPDVIEADDAIRSRSLHVLSGGGAALVLILVINQLGAIHPIGVRQGTIEAISAYAIVAVALFGWLVATSIWPPPDAARRRDGTVIGPA